jgi:hypothetical protein
VALVAVPLSETESAGGEPSEAGIGVTATNAPLGVPSVALTGGTSEGEQGSFVTAANQPPGEFGLIPDEELKNLKPNPDPEPPSEEPPTEPGSAPMSLSEFPVAAHTPALDPDAPVPEGNRALTFPYEGTRSTEARPPTVPSDAPDRSESAADAFCNPSLMELGYLSLSAGVVAVFLEPPQEDESFARRPSYTIWKESSAPE